MLASHSLLTTVLLLATLPSGEAGPNPKGWQTDYHKARAVAKQQNKPLFVVFR